MNAIIHCDAQRLEEDAERITVGLKCLGRDRSAWARKREEKDLKDLMEALKSTEMDVSLLLRECILADFQHGEDSPKVVSDGFREIFGCLDTLFNGLKKARLQLNNACILPATLEHLEVDSGRFRKLIGQVQRHLNAHQDQTAVSLKGLRGHLAQGSATAF